jgi:hypothetical protein
MSESFEIELEIASRTTPSLGRALHHLLDCGYIDAPCPVGRHRSASRSA